MFDRLRKSGVRGDGMSILYDEVFDKIGCHIGRAYEGGGANARIVCQSQSTIARGSPACDQAASEIYPCVMKTIHYIHFLGLL
jgi:hypothetical protein